MTPLILAALLVGDPVSIGEAASTLFGRVLPRRERRLCRARIRSLVPSPYGGMSIKFMIRLAGGGRAVYKPNQTKYGARFAAEIAAYRLARHLGVGLVPAACERRIPRKDLEQAESDPKHQALRARLARELVVDPDGRVRGAAIHWVPRVVDLKLEATTHWHAWLKPGSVIPGKSRRLAGEIADLLLLDLLFSNPDRFTGGNTLAALPSRRLLMIDNGADFRPVPHLNRKYHREMLARLGRVRRPTYRRLLKLSQRALRRLLLRSGTRRSGYLTRRERRALLKRRDALWRHVEALRRQHGDPAVFLP